MEDVQQELQYGLSAKRKGILPFCVHQNKWNSYIQAAEREFEVELFIEAIGDELR